MLQKSCRVLGPASAAAGLKGPTFERDFYLEDPAVAARKEEDIESFRKQNDIHVEGSSVPRPVTTFEEASFPGQYHIPASIFFHEICPTCQIFVTRLAKLSN